MKYIYILVAVIVTASVLLFVSSFIYLDRTKHRTYYYTVSMDDRDVGTIKIEKFDTEDKFIYKSAANIPFSPLFTEYRTRMVLDRKYNLESYFQERSGTRQTEFVYVENRKQLASFVAVFPGGFACLDSIPVKKDTFVFGEESLETYLPLIENYNFTRGKSQGFNALTYFWDRLPPMKRFVTLTSIRDEYLSIDSLGRPSKGRTSRRIKTENLLLKIRNYPQGSIWVAKSDRSLIKLETPKRRLKITRTFQPQKVEALTYILSSDKYKSEDVAFKNKDIQLAGTIAIPDKAGKLPAVLLVWGEGARDREYLGLFTSLADRLAKNGFVVMRFDARGMGSSGGDSLISTDNDIIGDIGSALEYLGTREEVDVNKIAVIGHSEGAIYALKAAAEKKVVKALVLMAPSLNTYTDDEAAARLNNMALKFKWSDEYLKLAMRSIQQTKEKFKYSSHNWTSILRKRCFLRNMRERLAEKPGDIIGSLKMPVLILRGKEDEIESQDFTELFDKTMKGPGSPGYSLTYYSYLGHFFGNEARDGRHRAHYEVDNDVAENISKWLSKNMPDKPVLVPEPGQACPQEPPRGLP